MIVDLGLINKTEKACALKPRKFVTPAILCAVAIQESNGIPYFQDTKPGSIFSMNLGPAICYHKKIGEVDGKPIFAAYKTGLYEKDIRRIITIPAKVNNYQPAKQMVGMMAKFRFEPSYWERNAKLENLEERFLYSCSWGVMQFMGPNAAYNLGPCEAGFNRIREFMCSPDMQLAAGADYIENIMAKISGHDCEHMYREYNSGNPNSTNPDVEKRALAVAARAKEIQTSIFDKRTPNV